MTQCSCMSIRVVLEDPHGLQQLVNGACKVASDVYMKGQA